MKINPIGNNNLNFTSAAAVVKGAANVVQETAKKSGGSSAFRKAFSSAYDKYVIQNLAKGIGKISSLKITEGAVDTISKWKSPYQRLCDIGSVVLTVFTVKDTLKSKKISEERKPFLVVNQILVTGISSVLAGIIDTICYKPTQMITAAHAQKLDKTITDKMINDLKNSTKKDDKALIEKAKAIIGEGADEIEAVKKALIYKKTEKFSTGLAKFKSTFIFTLIVRFLVPVALVPITAKIIDKLEERAKNKKEAPAENQAQIQPNQSQGQIKTNPEQK